MLVMLSISYPTVTSCGEHMSPPKGQKCWRGAVGTSDYARDVFDTALSKCEAYGERLTGLAAHSHSHTALRINQHCNPRFGLFARTQYVSPRSWQGRGLR
jgi:hypothetical protein